MDRMFVKPAAGLTVRHPRTHRLMPADGEWVDRDGFWQRRLRDKDVVAADPPAPAEPASGSEPPPDPAP